MICGLKPGHYSSKHTKSIMKVNMKCEQPVEKSLGTSTNITVLMKSAISYMSIDSKDSCHKFSITKSIKGGAEVGITIRRDTLVNIS